MWWSLIISFKHPPPLTCNTTCAPPTKQGNWVSALHKLASAVGRQLQCARDTTLAAAQSQPDDQFSDQQRPPPGAAAQLAEPELASREARLRRVLVRGTRAARAMAANGGAAPPGGTTEAGLATPVSIQQLALTTPQLLDLQQQQQQQLEGQGLEQQGGLGGASTAARQLQLVPDQLPGGEASGAAGPAFAPIGSATGGALQPAWAAGVSMPHLRPRPGPSRLAHQSSVQAGWTGMFGGEAADLDVDDLHVDLEPCAPGTGATNHGHAAGDAAAAPTGAAAAAAMAAAVAADAGALEAAAAISDAAMGDASLPDPVLQLQHLQLQHQAQMAQMLASGPLACGAAAVNAPSAGGPPHAAHYDEPIISLKEARREARSRSATPAASGVPQLPAVSFGAAVSTAAAAATGGMMEIDGCMDGRGHAAGAHAAGAHANPHAHAQQPHGNQQQQQHAHEEEDDEHDPIAAQLAGGAVPADDGALPADIGADFDIDLVAVPSQVHTAAAAAAPVPAVTGGVAGLLPLPGSTQFAQLQQQQQQQHVAAALAFQQQMMQSAGMRADGGLMAFAAQQMQPGANGNPQ